MSRALICAALLAAACGGGSSPTAPEVPAPATLTPVQATADWPASTPDAEGLDPSRLRELVGRIRQRDYGATHSLLVVRNGRLVVEEYFDGWSAERPHTIQSITKSVTSLLAGIAVERGLLAVGDPIVRFFPDYQPIANSDARKQAMTVRDLLTMRSGLDWTEANYTGSPLQQLNDCRCDWLRFVLDWPMREQPGTRWEYVSGGTILLGGVIGRAARTRLDQFAEAELFGPLAAAGASWFHGLPDGLPHSGGGLNLRPRDMAKLGLLVLDEGRWQGRPILTPAWIRESTQRIERGVATWASRSFDYGYYWWISSSTRGDVITASGARGQWIFISPADRLVLVSTAENPDGRGIAAVEFLHTYVLAAVRG